MVSCEEEDPVFEEFSGNNDPPSVDALQKATLIEAEIQHEILATEERIADLARRLSSLQTRASKYRRITTPFRRVPSEVLTEIFAHCLPTHRNPLLSASEAPVLLTRVCSRWRQVALASPPLWAQMHVTFCESNSVPWVSSDGEENMNRKSATLQALKLRCQVVRNWLTVLSGICPLSISLHYVGVFADGETDGPSEQDPTDELFELLAQNIHRCRDLDVNMPLEVYQRLEEIMKAASPSIDLKSLRSFRLSCYPIRPPSVILSTAPAEVSLLKAPNLKKLSLAGLSHSSATFTNLLSTIPSGPHLTHLSCTRYLTSTEIFSVLTHCSGLVHCSLLLSTPPPIDFSPEADSDSSLPNNIFLPRLLSLAITEDMYVLDSASCKRLYSSINAPLLKWFNYGNQPYYHTEEENQIQPDLSFPTVLQLLERFQRLTKLTLEPYNFHPHGLKRVFEVVSPTLTHLVLGQEAILRQPFRPFEAPIVAQTPELNDLLGWLTVSDSTPDTELLLPHLQVFEACPCRQSDEEVFRFVASRLATDRVDTLKLVRLRFYRKKQLDIEGRVSQLFTSEESRAKGAHPDSYTPIKFDLQYHSAEAHLTDFLSASYRVDHNIEYWDFSDTNEQVSQMSNWDVFSHQ
ncbi:hypothetical protein CVT26_013329 [Gymnopilus dilepis]|uniref:Uncharacterized protein n=1 Tax=Gymnopilus dilepis TaxID=231916 RepID=A0A409YF14_9AGAR|nr:hypothetical protein CVT26_013329 [Gymnopilus dilepis]